MIEPAVLYTEQLKDKFRKTWFDAKYMYYHNSVYFVEYEPDDNTWDRHQFAVLSNSGEVIGYIGYGIDRQTNSARDMGICNFSADFSTFAKDLLKVLHDIFMTYNLRKLCFSVVCGNPVEKHYDSLVSRCNGRVVGTFKDDTKLIDGNFYNLKHYEVLRTDYINSPVYKNHFREAVK